MPPLVDCSGEDWKPIVNVHSACHDELVNLGPKDCATPPECVIEATNAPPAPDNSTPQYVCEMMNSGGWVKNIPGSHGSPAYSYCAMISATGGNLSPGNWNECVKYGNAWHITAPSSNNKAKCYSTAGTHKDLCLHKNKCPLYVQTEADAKCVRYPTERACINTLKAQGYENCAPGDAGSLCRTTVDSGISVSNSGQTPVQFGSENHTMYNIILILVFIAFVVLGYYLVIDVEKIKKGTKGEPLPIKTN